MQAGPPAVALAVVHAVAPRAADLLRVEQRPAPLGQSSIDRVRIPRRSQVLDHALEAGPDGGVRRLSLYAESAVRRATSPTILRGPLAVDVLDGRLVAPGDLVACQAE